MKKFILTGLAVAFLIGAALTTWAANPADKKTAKKTIKLYPIPKSPYHLLIRVPEAPKPLPQVPDLSNLKKPEKKRASPNKGESFPSGS